jgi:hypothetical protein
VLCRDNEEECVEEEGVKGEAEIYKVKKPCPESSMRNPRCGAKNALDEDLMKRMGKASGCKMVRHGKGELTSIRMEYGSPAFQMWEDHHLLEGKEPPCLDDSDPMFTPVSATGLVPGVPPHLLAGVTEVFLFAI